MRRLAASLAVATVLAVGSGCVAETQPGPDPGAGGSGGGATPANPSQGTTPSSTPNGETELEARTFTAGEDIPVTLTLLSTEEGGRKGVYYAGYRPNVSFAGAEQITCSFGVPEGAREFAPGETGDVAISCTEDVTVQPEALGFSVVEGGREVGSGQVRLADAQ